MMTSIFHRRWLEVIFVGRNRAYGAYKLRLSEERTLAMALLITLGLLGGGLLLPALINSVEVVIPGPVYPDPDPFPPSRDPRPSAPNNPTNYRQPVTVVLSKHVVEIDSSDVDDTLDLPIATGVVTGSGGDTGASSGSLGLPVGRGQRTAPIVPDLRPLPFGTPIEVPPQYPGGEQELMADMKALLDFTPEMEWYGVEGTAYVMFIVDEHGVAKEPEIMRSVGFGSDEVIKEAILKLKRWRPGMQGGMAVPVYFAMPIRFHLTED
jgi:protein TonB